MMPSKIPARGAHVVLADASAACGLAVSAPRRSPNASVPNETSASTNRASAPRARSRSAFHAIGFPARRVTSAATASADAGGADAAPEGRGERRLEAELARRCGAEESERARAATRGVEAHLALHHLGLAPAPEALRGAQVRAVERARRGHVDGARSEARRAVAEVEVFAVEEVARIEAAELTEEVAADRHEGAVHPVDAVGHAPEPRPEPTERGVEQEMRERPEARRRRLPSAALTRETSAGDARARRARERLDQGGERAGQHARVGIQEHEHVTPHRLRAAVRARREAQV